jgi:hypothetical protein
LPSPIPKDNSTKARKSQLRSKALVTLERLSSTEPIVLECYGGMGKLFAACYSHLAQGIVIEKNPAKAERLLSQRGERWSVYQGETVALLRAGLGAHLAVNFLDVDPWGDPWPTIDAFLESERPQPRELMIVVNDGLRQLVQRHGSWTTPTLETAVRKYGNAELYNRYLDVCKQMMTERAVARGYEVRGWTGYYPTPNMTHYAALFLKTPPPAVHTAPLASVASKRKPRRKPAARTTSLR